jgi:uncharacterized repeat protein (TIGR02543 family)
MDVRIKLGSNWSSKVSQIYMNIGGVWQSIKSGYINIGTWQQFFLRIATPVNTAKPVVTGSKYLYGTLSGTLGTWTAPNGTNSYARQWQRADYDGSSTPGTFSSISGATSSTYTTTIDDNGKWIRLRVTATNLSGSDTAFSELDYISKYSPVALTIPVISGSASVDSTLTALTTVGTYWKNTTTNSGDTAPDSFSYRWYWGDTNETKGSNSSTYLVGNDDIGHTIRVDVTATNTGGSTTSTSNQTSTVGQAIGISNITFKDSNEDNGFNNRGNLVTATTTKLSWKVSGVNSSTTFRVRYRVFNNQTSAYWNPDSVTTTTASLAWVSYTSDYYNVGNISNVTISGSDAYVYDVFAINETFNGSTYGGGISRWTWEYEISAVIGGTRYYWVPGDTVSTSQSNDYWDIDATTNPTISPTSATRDTSTSVTFSGTLASYPASLSAYTYAYKMVYGDGTDSGWFYPNYGASNTTYSFTKTYSTQGSYSAYIQAIPFYAAAYSSITIFNPTTRTLSFDANGGSGAPSAQTGTDNGSGATITISATTPTRSGYSFSKWNTNSSGTGTDYNPSGSITLTSNITLYAIWTVAASYTITYNGNGNTSGSTSSTTGSGSVTLASNGFARTNCNFAGWNTNSAGNGTDYAAGGSYSLSADVTLYAKWTARTVTAAAPSNFRFVGNSGSGSTSTKQWAWNAQTTVTNGTFVGYRWQLTTTNPNAGGWNGDFTEGTQTATSRTITVPNASSNPRWMRVCVNATDGLGAQKNGSFTGWL